MKTTPRNRPRKATGDPGNRAAVKIVATPKPKIVRNGTTERKRGCRYFSIRVKLPPRDAVGDCDAEPLSIHKTHGVKSGMGVWAFVKLLLELNERLPLHRKIVDVEIRRQILEEFPHLLERKGGSSVRRLSQGKIGIAHYRAYYNSGAMSGGVKPDPQSRAYDRFGRPIPKKQRRIHPDANAHLGIE